MLKTLERYPVISWTITILLGVFIFYMSSRTFSSSFHGPNIPYQSYIYHFSVFAVFSFFLLVSLTKGNLRNKGWFSFGLLLAIAYALSDEIHQYFVPGRFCSYNDALVNSLGIYCSSIFYLALRKK